MKCDNTYVSKIDAINFSSSPDSKEEKLEKTNLEKYINKKFLKKSFTLIAESNCLSKKISPFIRKEKVFLRNMFICESFDEKSTPWLQKLSNEDKCNKFRVLRKILQTHLTSLMMSLQSRPKSCCES